MDTYSANIITFLDMSKRRASNEDIQQYINNINQKPSYIINLEFVCFMDTDLVSITNIICLFSNSKDRTRRKTRIRFYGLTSFNKYVYLVYHFDNELLFIHLDILNTCIKVSISNKFFKQLKVINPNQLKRLISKNHTEFRNLVKNYKLEVRVAPKLYTLMKNKSLSDVSFMFN